MPHRRRFRFGHQAEDADDGSDLVYPHADEAPWRCDCGTLNHPAHQGGEWPTCVYCGAFRADVDDDYDPELMP
jgi:hypothetical protein